MHLSFHVRSLDAAQSRQRWSRPSKDLICIRVQGHFTGTVWLEYTTATAPVNRRASVHVTVQCHEFSLRGRVLERRGDISLLHQARTFSCQALRDIAKRGVLIQDRKLSPPLLPCPTAHMKLAADECVDPFISECESLHLCACSKGSVTGKDRSAPH